MPVALSMRMRQLLVAEHNKGRSIRSLATAYSLCYTTACRLLRRYKTKGQQELSPHYNNCGGHSPYPPLIHRAAVWLKRLHPLWGAAFIKLLLQERYRVTIASVRTLQRWFVKAGLQPAKSQLQYPQKPQAKKVHDTWQVDAKEKLRLQDGNPFCYLTVVDQKSGSLLDGFVFPPLPFQ